MPCEFESRTFCFTKIVKFVKCPLRTNGGSPGCNPDALWHGRFDPYNGHSFKKEKKMTLTKLLAKLGATVSMSEGRRQIVSGAVKLNGFPVTKFDVEHVFHAGDVIEVGKNFYEVKEAHLKCVEV